MTQTSDTTSRPRRVSRRPARAPVVMTPPPAQALAPASPAMANEQVGLKATKALLHSKIDAIRRVVAKGTPVTAEGLIQNALQQMEMAQDRRIKLCTPRSILYAVLVAAYTGLDFLGEQAWLIPMEKTRMINGQQVHEHWYATLYPGYRGLCTVAARAGWFLDCQEVRANDHLLLDIGANAITHTFAFGQRGDLIGTYCAVRRMLDGRIFHIEAMDKGEIDLIARDTAAWTHGYSEMAKKSVCKRGFKWLPKDRADARLLAEVEHRNDTAQELDDLAGPGCEENPADNEQSV